MSSKPHVGRLLAASVGVCALVLALISSGSLAASGFACNPKPGLGSLALVRSGKVHLIDLETCRDRVVRTRVRGRVEFGADGRVHVLPRSAALRSPDGRYLATVRVTGKERSLRNTIWVKDRRTGKSHAVFSAGVWGATTGLDSPGPIVLLGWSGDDRWLFFAIDPGSSASIAADGLILRLVSIAGDKSHKLAAMLTYQDYFRWCGGRLVFTAGVDRLATHNKRLLMAPRPDGVPAPSSLRPAAPSARSPARRMAARSSSSRNPRAATRISSRRAGRSCASASTARSGG